MKKRIISTLLIAAMSAFLFTGCSANVVVMESEAPVATEAFDVSTIRAQDDFFGYCNAEYLLDAELDPYSGTTGSFDVVNNLVDEQLNSVIREIANGDRSTYLPGSNEQIIYDVYWQFYNYTTGNIDFSDAISASILDNVTRIDSCSSYDEFFDTLMDITTDCGNPLMFDSFVYGDIYDSTKKTLFIYPETFGMREDFDDISRGLYQAESIKNQIRDRLYFSGVDYEEATNRAVALTYMLIDISANTDFEVMDSTNYYNYVNLMNEEEISSVLTNMSLEDYYSIFGLRNNPDGTLVIFDVNQLMYIDSLMIPENLRAFKDLVIMKYIENYTLILPEDMGGTFVVYSDDSGALTVVKQFLYYELGEEYAERYMDPEVVADVTSMVEDMVAEYINLVGNADWMEDETKEAIITKLNDMAYFIGAGEPHDINPDDANVIGDNVFETIKRIMARSWSLDLDSITKPVERNGFATMSPQAVNACYAPSLNSINITVAIMNEPFYSPGRSYAANLGGIGAVIGHEISHAFDSTGMNFDYQGNYNPTWISEDDRNDFDELCSEFADYYSEFVVMEVYHVDGEQTLGENMADASSIQCALNIVTDDEGRRELFESYARIWASVTTDRNALENLEIDEHSPDRIRVNAVVSMFDCFYELYDVREGDGMYIAPEDRVLRW